MAFSALVGHEALHSAGQFMRPISRTFEYVANWATANEMPSPEQIIKLFIRGWISPTVADEVLLIHGISSNLDGTHLALVDAEAGNKRRKLWNQVITAEQELPSPHELGILRNRGVINDVSYDKGLQHLGFWSATVRQGMGNLRYEVPGPSDLVRFAVRHVFEPDLVKHFGYPDERDKGPFLLDIFHQAAGINYPIFTGPLAPTVQMVTGRSPAELASLYTDQGLPEPTWADAYWWAHWVLPSPSQGYEMLFRLRPDRDRRFDPAFARDLNFGIEDLNLLLRANDYPPFYRAALAAIAHRVPGIRFMRQLRSTDVFTKADIKELLLRQGYSEGDSEVLAESIERNDRDTRRRSVESQARGQLAKYWELGAITKEQYGQLLTQHGLTAHDAASAADLTELDLRYKRLDKIINFIRGQYLKGVLTEFEALDQLTQAGVVEPRRSAYLTDWKMELQEKHREVSAQKAVQWACKGIIPVADLARRLENLGYRPEDVTALVQEAAACSAGLAARAAAAAARQQAQSVRALQQQQRAAAQAILAARRQLAQHGTPAQLRKWYCAGHLGQAELYSRLHSLGWPDADISRLVADCTTGTGGGSGGQRGGSTIGGGQTPGGA